MKSYQNCRVILLQSRPGEGFPFLLNVNGRGDILYKPSKGYYYTGFYLKEQQFEPYHLYIVSDEEIKKGDWCYSERANNVYKEPDPEFANASNYIWKIIASTNSDLNLPKISEQFIDDYMFKYNIKKKIEEVEVEYMDYSDYNPSMFPDIYPKVNSEDNTINIRSVKENWNIEEIEEIWNYGAAYGDTCIPEAKAEFERIIKSKK